MIQLDARDMRPLFEQIKEKIKEIIVKGIIKEDEKLPSVREGAVLLAINPNTIQRAYKELENEGYIYSVRGKGYFASAVDERAREMRINDLTESLKKTLAELRYLGVEKSMVTNEVEKYFKEEAQ